MHNIAQTGGTPDAGIDGPEAWDITTGDGNVIIGVIDTGVDYTHEDLKDNMWTNSGEIPGNGIDDDGNGYVDDVHGYDFVNNDGDPMDDHGYGTHVAGTIARVGDNNIGVVGVNWNTKIAGIKFLSARGGGSTAGAINSIIYANNNGIWITNNSWGAVVFPRLCWMPSTPVACLSPPQGTLAEMLIISLNTQRLRLLTILSLLPQQTIMTHWLHFPLMV